jgi:hypothetical protein
LKRKLNVAETTQKCQAQEEYNEKNRETKSNVMKDKRKWVEELATKAENAAKTGNLKDLCDTTKAVARNRKYWQRNQPVRDKDGRMLTDNHQQLNGWHEYFTGILNDTTG